jgi:uncharacterized protein (TIGR02217 family)
MSNAIFPKLPGEKWGMTRTPSWSNIVKTTTNGRDYTISNWNVPRREYKIPYSILRELAVKEQAQLEGFFNARRGNFDTFLFDDTSDNAATLQGFGIGDGVTTQFQVVRSRGGWVESVSDFNGAPAIYINGVLQSSGYLISAKGVVTFSIPPVNTAVITWTGKYYWRCRFVNESLSFEQIFREYWNVESLVMITVKP